MVFKAGAIRQFHRRLHPGEGWMGNGTATKETKKAQLTGRQKNLRMKDLSFLIATAGADDFLSAATTPLLVAPWVLLGIRLSDAELGVARPCRGLEPGLPA